MCCCLVCFSVGHVCACAWLLVCVCVVACVSYLCVSGSVCVGLCVLCVFLSSL